MESTSDCDDPVEDEMGRVWLQNDSTAERGASYNVVDSSNEVVDEHTWMIPSDEVDALVPTQCMQAKKAWDDYAQAVREGHGPEGGDLIWVKLKMTRLALEVNATLAARQFRSVFPNESTQSVQARGAVIRGRYMNYGEAMAARLKCTPKRYKKQHWRYKDVISERKTYGEQYMQLMALMQFNKAELHTLWPQVNAGELAFRKANADTIKAWHKETGWKDVTADYQLHGAESDSEDLKTAIKKSTQMALWETAVDDIILGVSSMEITKCICTARPLYA